MRVACLGSLRLLSRQLEEARGVSVARLAEPSVRDQAYAPGGLGREPW